MNRFLVPLPVFLQCDDVARATAQVEEKGINAVCCTVVRSEEGCALYLKFSVSPERKKVNEGKVRIQADKGDDCKEGNM